MTLAGILYLLLLQGYRVGVVKEWAVQQGQVINKHKVKPHAPFRSAHPRHHTVCTNTAKQPHTYQLSLFWRDSPLFGAKFPTVPLFFFDSVPCTFYASKMSQFGPISYLANIPLFLTENSTFSCDTLATMQPIVPHVMDAQTNFDPQMRPIMIIFQWRIRGGGGGGGVLWARKNPHPTQNPHHTQNQQHNVQIH